MPSIPRVVVLLLTSQAFWAAANAKDSGRLVRQSVSADGSVQAFWAAANAKDSGRLVRQSVSADGSVLSASVRAHQFEEPQMSSRVQEVLHEFQDMARMGTAPEPEKIRTIKSIVDDELLPDLHATHDSAAKQVGVNLAAIVQCNTNALARLQEIKATTEASVDQDRTEHASCREEEKMKKAKTLPSVDFYSTENGKVSNSTITSACAELDNFLNAIVVPAELPITRPRDEMVQYVKTMSDYFCPKGPEVTDLDDKCNTALEEHAKHKAECDKLQAIFELGFCTWRTELADACTALSECHNSALKIYNEHVLDTKELVKKWKVEYGALKKILCYVHVWLSDNNVKTADADQLKKCDGSDVDTSPMNIDYGSAAGPAQCSLAAVENYPGTPGFVTTEYAKFSDYANTVIPCLQGQA